MVAVSVWGGAHDGARLLVSSHSIRQARELRFMGHSYIVTSDARTGWTAVYTERRQ